VGRGTSSSPVAYVQRRAWASVTVAAAAAAAATAAADDVPAVTFDIDASNVAAGSRRTKRYRNYTLVDFFDLSIGMIWELVFVEYVGRDGSDWTCATICLPYLCRVTEYKVDGWSVTFVRPLH